MKVHADYLNEDDISISIDMNNVCNYKCSYCYARKNVIKSWNDIQLNQDQLKYLNECLKDIKYKLNVTLVGGEPTLNPNLNYFLELLYNNPTVKTVTIITNGSRDIKNILNNEKLSYTFTLHASSIKDEKIFIKNILHAKKYNIEIMCEDDKKIENYILCFLKKYKNIININNVNSTFITDEFKDPKFVEYGRRFNQHDINYNGELLSPIEIFERGLNKFKCWNCLIQYFYLRVDGDLFNFCLHQNLGNIYHDKDIFKNLKLEYIKCPFEKCDNICRLDMWKNNDS